MKKSKNDEFQKFQNIHQIICYFFPMISSETVTGMCHLRHCICDVIELNWFHLTQNELFSICSSHSHLMIKFINMNQMNWWTSTKHHSFLVFWKACFWSSMWCEVTDASKTEAETSCLTSFISINVHCTWWWLASNRRCTTTNSIICLRLIN